MYTAKMWHNSWHELDFTIFAHTLHGVLIGMSLVIVNAVIIVNIIMLYCKYYLEKLHAVYLVLCKPTLLTQQKLNVISYKHERHALAYSFKASSWQI